MSQTARITNRTKCIAYAPEALHSILYLCDSKIRTKQRQNEENKFNLKFNITVLQITSPDISLNGWLSDWSCKRLGKQYFFFTNTFWKDFNKTLLIYTDSLFILNIDIFVLSFNILYHIIFNYFCLNIIWSSFIFIQTLEQLISFVLTHND